MIRRPRVPKPRRVRDASTRKPTKPGKANRKEKKSGTSFWGIAGGIAAAVVGAILIGWLTKFGIIPKTDEKTATPTPTQRPAQVPTPQKTASAPFTVSVGNLAADCTDWIAHRTPVELRHVPIESVREWVTANAGGISNNPIEFTIQGTSAAAVTLLDMRAKVTLRKPLPPASAIVQMECNGGPPAFRWMTLNLDRQPPKLTAEVPTEKAVLDFFNTKEITPIRFPYKVSVSKPESFMLMPQTLDCDCLWEIYVDWTSEGKRGSLKIDNNGKPFRTIADRGVRWRCSVYGQWNCQEFTPTTKP